MAQIRSLDSWCTAVVYASEDRLEAVHTNQNMNLQQTYAFELREYILTYHSIVKKRSSFCPMFSVALVYFRAVSFMRPAHIIEHRISRICNNLD